MAAAARSVIREGISWHRYLALRPPTKMAGDHFVADSEREREREGEGRRRRNPLARFYCLAFFTSTIPADEEEEVEAKRRKRNTGRRIEIAIYVDDGAASSD